jgi:probable addiction module antidote protein
MSESFSRYDVADYLGTAADICAYLEASAEENDPAQIALALGAAARARNMTQLARDAGMTREGLYKALSADGDPSFATITKVARALGLQVTFKPLAE